MNNAYEFFKKAGVFYLATTTDNGQAKLRPFGAVSKFEDKLYLVTNNQKDVYKQLLANPKAEICALGAGGWMRVTGELKEDTRREARVAMMNENEASLSSMYTVDDNLMTVFYFENAKVTSYENGKEPVVEDLSL
ncbi:pyridoxamine 5'-phosphate oxidase family protein [Lachnospira multipara]|uniref:Uncharacterized protein, pyridoxamine 5'-phosphate oxidase (PNPOx-like) family n=1 Tax=Lachnospira multipara TaxID=28051 RepID=A0A1H5TV26_9FIRM|nr:pyridoxamine 5'-phosphate oxidase family protein [Lachnospira multipara]SEF66068.1 Uncharacterized protein, pyridoxamine 5'-phosphate oxidase (PNPOx-like) family [Lachnospira multipara]